jgi:hypothetical protein
MQGIFAGYFCLTSIFHVWKLISEGGGTPEELQLLAAAQRYYVLGHAAFVTGLLATMDYRDSGRWRFQTSMSRARLALALGFGALLLAIMLSQIPGFGQFASKLRTVAPVAVILSLALALRDGESTTGIVGVGLYGYIVVTALLSGWKESIISALALFLLYLYPDYRRTALILGVIGVILSISVVPAYNNTFRRLSWNQGVPEKQAAETAYKRLAEGEVNLRQQAWEFLSGRATQIEQFASYIDYTPRRHPFYGLSIAERAVVFLFPRELWPEKPIVEKVVMQRVYRSGLTSRRSGVSMKPQNVIDGYLSGGAVGVFLTCLVMGIVASWTSRMAEAWFGGYTIGTQVMHVGIFIGVVRTNSFEFWVNYVFWSFILLVILFAGLRTLGFLQESSVTRPNMRHPSPAVAPER